MERQIIKQLEMLTGGKNNSYAILAEYILKIENLDNLRLKHLENNCHVSGTTIIRFCKEIGFNGFPEFKYKLEQEMQEDKKNTINKEYSLSENTNKHLDSIMTSFKETRNLLTDNKLALIVNFINEAKLINVYAVGSTYLVARDLELKLDRIKKYCKSYNDKNLQFFAAKNCNSDSLAIGITYSGKTQTVIDNLEISKEQGAKTILITNEKNQHFEGLYDIVIYVSSTDMRNRLITTSSRLTLLYIVDLIFNSYINTNNDEINAILKHNSYL